MISDIRLNKYINILTRKRQRQKYFLKYNIANNLQLHLCFKMFYMRKINKK